MVSQKVLAILNVKTMVGVLLVSSCKLAYYL